MKTPLHLSAVIIFLLCLSTKSFSQAPVANFTVSPDSGCAPLVVTFVSTSTGNPTGFNWDFGDGGSSVLPTTAAHTYSTPGTYTVKLTVSNAAGSNTKTITAAVTVLPSPTVNFTGSPLSGCPPLTVNFTDNSNPNFPGPATYDWSFGTGIPSSVQNPVHTFSIPGYYHVTLKVTNAVGCYSSALKSQYIQVFTPPVADFTFNPICSAPGTTTFTSTVNGVGGYTYSWDYGDGTPFGTGSTTTHTYANSGNYNAKLIVTDLNGCKDTVVKAVNVGTLKAAFTAPAVACVNAPVHFINNSVSAASYLWFFGDGNSITGFNVTHTYLNAGTFNVTMIATDLANVCRDTIIVPITVSNGPVTDFTISPPIPCPASDTLFFTNTSVGAVSYRWNFGDGSPVSTAVNPYHIYNYDSVYIINLEATDQYGCKNDAFYRDTFYKTDLTIGVPGTNYNHCVPTTIPFHGYLSHIYWTLEPPPLTPRGWLSANLPISITSITWDFGDGSPTVTGFTPSHTFTTPGTFPVTATALTSNGCTLVDTFPVHVDTLPTALFSINGDTLCLSDTLIITDLSIGSTSAVYFSYPPGPPLAVANTFPNFRLAYYSPDDTGIYTLQMIAFNNFCADTFTLQDTIVAKGPRAAPVAQVDCDTPTLVRFQDLTKYRITSRLWNFGDGNTDTSKNPTHIYNALGTYNASLTVFDDSTGCSYKMTVPLRLYVPTADFTAIDTAVCRRDTIYLTPQFSAPIAAHKFTITPPPVIAGPVGAPPTWWLFPDAGLYTVQLTYTDGNGCVHDTTKTDYILVGDPNPNFVAVPSVGCSPLNTLFVENGGNTPGAFSTNWKWEFGDNTTATITNDSVNHTYAPGKFTVKVVVTDNVGCIDSLTRLLYIESHNTIAAFTANDTTICMGDTVKFKNASTSATGSALSYTWDFGDGTPTVSTKDPIHIYRQPGAYTVTLIAKDNIGCADTLVITNYIRMTKPDASFSMDDSLALCPPLIVQFTNNSLGATGYQWVFGDGSNSLVPNPSNIYSNPGKYNVMLIAIDAYGCPDTAFSSAEVLGYAGGVTYTPLKGCNPLQVNFTANLTGVNSFLWDFSDGTVLPATSTTISHTYTTPGKFLPKIVFTDSVGCVNSSNGLDTIYVDDIISDFATSPVCINTPVIFKDTSYSYFSAVNGWNWIIDGQFAGGQNTAVMTFPATGTYSVAFAVKNANGCKDTVYKNITVLPLPTITASLDTIICVGDAALLSAVGGVSYEWSPTGTLGCATCQTTTASPATPTSYVVTGTDANGCKNKDTVKVNLQNKTTSEIGPGGEICADSSIQLSASGAQRYEWTPEASLDNPRIANPLASPKTTTVYTVLAYEGSCPPDTSTVTVIVHPLPTVKATGATTIVPGNSVNLNATGTGIHTYLWTPSQSLSCETCSSPVAKPTGTTAYVIMVASDFGCRAYDTVTITVLCDQSQLFIPNTFSPNGDGENDVFYPRGLGLQRIRSFRIYNRWGELVYERQGIQLNDVASAWDGTFKGNALNPDVFVYVVEGVCDGGEPMTWKGDVTLIR